MRWRPEAAPAQDGPTSSMVARHDAPHTFMTAMSATHVDCSRRRPRFVSRDATATQRLRVRPIVDDGACSVGVAGRS
jgi:hypothetical protein